MTTSTDNRNLTATCPNRSSKADKYEFDYHSIFTSQDWQMFLDMQDTPPEPTERMKKALRTYNKIIDSQP